MDAHPNLAVSRVVTAPSPASSGTSLVVTTGEGVRFATTPPFNATIWPGGVPDPSSAEIVRVTNRSTDTLTITRAQESTSARTIVVGDLIAATVTAKSLTDVETSQELAFSTYKDLTEWLKSYIASGAAANTYIMYGSSGIAVGGVNSAFGALYLDPADYAAGSRTTKLRIKAAVITNSVAPVITFTFHLYSALTFGGGSNVAPTITAVATSLGNVAIATPGASTRTVAVSSEFDFPAAGWCALACVASGTNAVNAIPQYMAKLQMRQV